MENPAFTVDFPIKISIFRGCSTAMFDYQRVTRILLGVFPKIFRSGAPSVKCSNLGGNASAMAWGMAIALRFIIESYIV